MANKSDLNKLPYALICWFWPLNESRPTPRSKEDRKELRLSIAKFGIKEGTSAPALVWDKHSKIWTTEHTKILENEWLRRRGIYEQLKADLTETGRLDQEAFEQVYCDSEKNVRKPVYLGNSWFSRDAEMLSGMTLRYKGFHDDGINYAPVKELKLEIPVLYQIYNSDQEREDAQSDENQFKDFCNVKPSDYDCLLWVWKRFQTRVGFRMQDAKNRFPGTVGQRNFQICKLAQAWSPKFNNRFPGESVREDAQIIDRINPMNKKPDSNYIRIQAFNAMDLTGLIARSSPDSLAELNSKIDAENDRNRNNAKPMKAHLVPLTREELEKYLSAKSPSKNTPKSLELSVWKEEIGKDNRLLEYLAKGQINADTSPLQHVRNFTDVYNPVFEDLESGKSSHLSLVMKWRNDPAVVKVLELLESGRTDLVKLLSK